MAHWIDVSPPFAPGDWRSIDVDGTPVAVFNANGEYYAIEDVCTHDGNKLTGGAIDGDQIVCPRHGARFSLRTGAALTAPAYEDVATFPLRIHDGMVQVRDARWD